MLASIILLVFNFLLSTSVVSASTASSAVLASEGPTLRIYFSPLTTQDYLDYTRNKLKHMNVDIIIKDVVFSSKGYLQSYTVLMNPECGDTLNGKEMTNDLQQFGLGAIVIGEECQYGSFTMTVEKDMTTLFFPNSTPDFDFVTWPGNMDELTKLDWKSIYDEN